MLALLPLQLFMNLVKAKPALESSCPDSIHKVVWNGGNGYQSTEVHQIYQTLARCGSAEKSSIRTLHLSIQQSGCVLNPDDAWNFDFQPGDRFPALHELHLNGYDFNNSPNLHYGGWDFQDQVYHFWRWIADVTGIELFRPMPEIAGWDTRGANLENWKAAMDWTELRDLDLEAIDAIFLLSMQTQLPALKSLKLGWLRSDNCLVDNVTDFITQLNPLSQLSLRGHTNKINLTHILDRHGASLETLEIHEWEGDHFCRPTLSRPQLERISEKCPSLSKLGVDINRNGTWPFELLDPLAANRNLSSLELWFELGMNEHGEEHPHDLFGEGVNKTRDFRKPLVNGSSSLCLFKRLRGLKQGVELQRLTLVVGDADRKYSHMMRSPAWGETLAEVYECSVLDSNGDRKNDGETWCKQLPRGKDVEEKFDFDNDNSIDEELRRMEEEELRKVQAEFEL